MDINIYEIIDKMTSLFKPNINRKIADFFYKRSVKKILTSLHDVNISNHCKPIDLLNYRQFRGLIDSLLKPNCYCYSVTDIAVAINISTSHFASNVFNNHSNEIINLSYHFLNEIKESIVSNNLVKGVLADYKKDIECFNENSDRESIERLFMNKKELFKHYFKTFNDERYNHCIRIWHQANNTSWADWSKTNSIDLNINPYKIREGFFLQGFDYYNIVCDESLQFASNHDGYEFFNKRVKGDTIIWVG